MKQIVFGTFCFFLLTPLLAFGQIYVPTPVSDAEIRDGSSLKMRSIELERVKRDADKVVFDKPDKEREIKFALIKEDFENIQKLQSLIVKSYTTGKNINYEKIGSAATEMRMRSVRLDENLFNANSVADEKENKRKNSVQLSLRDLIIELDKYIGRFVSSPIFQNTKLVDTKTSESAQKDLVKILLFSDSIAKQSSSLKK